MQRSKPSFVRSGSTKGFTLAEVAIAVAIAALGIVTILGALPTGLDNLRKAGNKVSISRIYQQMLNELQSADWGVKKAGGDTGWDKLDEYQQERRYFDSEGTVLEEGTENFDMRLTYVAMYDFPKSTADVSMPEGDSDSASGERDELRRVLIFVANSTKKDVSFGSSDKPDEIEVLPNQEFRAFTVCRQF